MEVADEMTSILTSTMLNSIDKKILKIKKYLKMNYIINKLSKCLNKPRKHL